MTPTSTQIAEWREEFESVYMAYHLKKFHDDQNTYIQSGMTECWLGYLRARTEQATEIAELKAKLEHLKQVVLHDRIEWEDFPPTSQLAFADLLKD